MGSGIDIAIAIGVGIGIGSQTYFFVCLNVFKGSK